MRNRNVVVLALCGTLLFGLTMAAYVVLDLAGRDTDGFLRFLSILIVSLLPSTLAALRANTAAAKTSEVAHKVDQVVEQTNGGLDERIERAVERRLKATGQYPLPGRALPPPPPEEGAGDGSR